MLLKNARLASGQPVDLLLKDGVIAAMGLDLAAGGEEVLDCAGRTVLPAFVSAGRSALGGSMTALTAAIGYPWGSLTPAARTALTRDCLVSGADVVEIAFDMAALRSGRLGEEQLALEELGRLAASYGAALAVGVDLRLLERMEQVDMAGPYYYATFVCVTKADSPLASAQGLSDLTGTATAQSGTDWYEFCLPQIEGAEIQSAAETAPAMIMAVESGTVDFICTDMPTAMGAVATYDDLVILDFSDNPEDDFQFASEAERDSHINIGMSVQKGNTVLLEAMNDVLSTMTEDDFTELMNQAVSVQPEI